MRQTLPRRSPAAGRLVLFCALLPVSGCQRKQAPHQEPVPHYLVGAPWQGRDAVWFYPREQLSYHATGLAIVETTHPQPLTADGEAYDPRLPAAAHQTLQLPSVVRVTNLDNGLQLLLRLNDRGPDDQGRVLALTPAAADRLEIQPGVPARVAVDLDPDRSQALGAGPQLAIAAAPVQDVQQQSLGPAGSAEGAASGSTSGKLPTLGIDLPEQRDQDPLGSVRRTAPAPSALWIDGGQFQKKSYAEKIAATLGGAVRTEGGGRQTSYLVRLGPFQRTPDADAALDRARQAGVTGARIIVE